MSDKLDFLAAPSAVEGEDVRAEPGAAGPTSDETSIGQGPTVTPLGTVETGHVPISALLDERERRQTERAAREDLERQLAAIRAQAEPQVEPAPEQVIHEALHAQNMRSSRRFAEREYGKDVIAAVHDWATRQCEVDPAFNQQMFAAEDPYENAYQAYSREQLLQSVGSGDLAAFRAWQVAQGVAEARQSSSRTPTPAQAAPRSLATAPNAGGRPSVLIGPGQAFATVIPK
jgi:hypothetical protein